MRSRALLIAINHYYSSMRALRGPLGDADDLREWLVSQQVDPIKELLSVGDADVFTARPIAADVEDWLDGLNREAGKVAQEQGPNVEFPLGNRLYIFYGGHGYNAYTAGSTGIFPRTRPDRWDVFPFGPLVQYLQYLAYFQEIVVLVDACREVIDYSHDPTWNRRPTPSPNSSKVKVLLLYAADAAQKTQEMDFGGGRFRGVISQAFLWAVKGLASSENGTVTATRLKEVVINAVRSKLPDANPKIDIPNEEMVITETGLLNPILEFECEAGAEGPATLRRDSGGETQIELQVGINQFDVPLGSYQLILASGAQLDVHATWDVNHVKVAKPAN